MATRSSVSLLLIFGGCVAAAEPKLLVVDGYPLSTRFPTPRVAPSMTLGTPVVWNSFRETMCELMVTRLLLLEVVEVVEVVGREVEGAGGRVWNVGPAVLPGLELWPKAVSRNSARARTTRNVEMLELSLKIAYVPLVADNIK